MPREDLAGEIEAAFGRGRMAGLAGEGSVGKTVAALQYARERAGEYPGGRFLVSSGEGQAIGALAQLAHHLGVSREVSDEEKARQVKDRLGAGPNALLVVDDVAGEEEWEGWREWLPGGAVRVLVTSRMGGLVGVEEVDVGGTSVAEGRAILARYRGHAGAAEADRVVEAVGGDVVGLSAVGVYLLRQHEVGVGEYADELMAGGGMGRALDDAYGALDEVERRVVDYAAVLPVGRTPREWLGWLVGTEQGEAVRFGPGQGGAVEEAIERLLEVGVLRAVTANGAIVGLCRRQAGWYADRLGDSAGRAIVWNGVIRLAAERGKGIGEAAVNPRLRAELGCLSALVGTLAAAGHGLAATGLANALVPPLEKLTRFDEAAASLERVVGARGGPAEGEEVPRHVAALAGLGRVRFKQRRLEEARGVTERAIAVGERVLGPEQARVAGMYDQLGVILSEMGDYPGAEARMWRAIGVRRKHVPEDHPSMAVLYSDLAIVLMRAGKLAGAREQMERAVGVQERHLDPEDRGLMANVAALGRIARDLGDYPAARGHMERAIAIEEAHRPGDHPDHAARLADLASVLEKLGEYRAARERLERAIEIVRKHFPEDHPRVSVLRANLASAMKELGDHEGARELLARVLECDERRLGPDHPDLATRYANFAMMLKEGKDLVRARAYMQRAIALDERHLPADHPTLGMRYGNLALLLLDAGDPRGARAWLERAVAIHEKSRGPDHPSVAIAYSNLSLVLKRLGDLAGARDAIERAMEISTRRLGPDHPEMATRHSNLGLILRALGDLDGARRAAARAVEIAEANLGAGHPRLVTYYGNLSLVLWQAGELAEARACLTRAVELLEGRPGRDGDLRVAMHLRYLAMVEADAGDFGRAADLVGRAADLRRRHMDERMLLVRQVVKAREMFERLANTEPDLAKRTWAAGRKAVLPFGSNGQGDIA